MTVRNIGFRFKAEGKESVRQDLRDIGQAGKAAGAEVAAGFDQAGQASERLTGYTEKQIAAFKRRAAIAREEARAEASQAKFNAVLGVGGGTGLRASDFLTADEVGGKRRMTRQQRAGAVNLFRQGGDVLTGVFSGQSPGMIAAQQLPQILDAAATSGFKLSAAMIGVGAAVTGVVVAIGAAAAAQAAYEASTLKLEVAARGLGAASGQTAEQLNAQAQAGAEAGDVSVRAARDMAAAYANTGKIGGGVMTDLIGLTKSYAATTTQEAAAATKELGAAFADPAKGAAELNEKLNFLSVAEQQHIENLAAAGDRAGAQQLMVEKLKGALLDASAATTGWGHAFDELGRKASNAWDAVGKAVDRAFVGGDDAQRLTDLRRARANEQEKIFGGSKHTIAQFDAEIEEIRKRYVSEQDRIRQGAVNARDRDRQSVVDRYADPKIKALQDQRNARSIYLLTGGKEGDATVKAIDREISALKAGYGSAAEQARALEQSHSKAITAGRRQASQSAKDAREAAQEAEKLARQKASLADHELDNQRKLAAIRGDASVVDMLDRQARLQQEINRYLAEGFALETARANARAQIAAEMRAESDILRRDRSNPEGFVSSADRMKAAAAGEILPSKMPPEFFETLRVGAGSSFRSALVSAGNSDEVWSIFKQRLKMAALEGFADSATNALFGSRDGSKSGLIAAGAKALHIPGFASGTNNAPEGYAWVGEQGPELRKLRSGDQITPHDRAVQMARAANAAAYRAPSLAAPAAAPTQKVEIVSKMEIPPGYVPDAQLGRMFQQAHDSAVRTAVKITQDQAPGSAMQYQVTKG